MLIRALTRRLHHPEPDAGGTGTAPPEAPAPEAAAPAAPVDAPAPDPAAAAAVATPEEDNSKFIMGLLDNIGKEPVEAKKTETPPADKTQEKPAPQPKAETEDLTPPDGMSDRAKERWATLTERVSTTKQQLAEATAHVENVRELVSRSTLAPEEFVQALDLGRMYKSNKPDDLKAALARLDEIRADVATRLGVDAPGVDLLAGHEDLKADVESMAITRERALEIARLRNTEKTVKSAETQQDAAEQYKAQIAQAGEAMNAVLAKRAAEPGHAAKLAVIEAHFKNPERLQKFVATYQPDQWPDAIMLMYEAIQVPAAPAAPQGQQPLRPQPVVTGVRTMSGPVTAESAVSNAFASIGL